MVQQAHDTKKGTFSATYALEGIPIFQSFIRQEYCRGQLPCPWRSSLSSLALRSQTLNIAIRRDISGRQVHSAQPDNTCAITNFPEQNTKSTPAATKWHAYMPGTETPLSMKVVLNGLETWSTRLSMGPLPVAPYWAAKPRHASIARRPFLISFSFSSLVFSADSLQSQG